MTVMMQICQTPKFHRHPLNIPHPISPSQIYPDLPIQCTARCSSIAPRFS
jgi:hypothetical protein